MVRASILFVLSSLAAMARPPAELLKSVEHHYASANSFEVKGRASGVLPGTSWKVTYAFDTQAMQPSFLPLDVHSTTMQDISTLGPFTTERTDRRGSDAFPTRSINRHPFGNYQRLTHHMLEAIEVGPATISVDGRTHACQILDVTYDTSPDFRPHSQVAHHRLWIDPGERTVLREEASFDGVDWTADVLSYSFDQPVSAETLKALQDFQKQPKDRPEWVGRELPNIKVNPLSGPAIKLTDLRGKPVLLDFWASYCPPCKSATLHAQELAERYKSAGLVVITFTQDNADDARLWAAHNHITLPIVLDLDKTAFSAFDINGIPEAVLAGSDGKVRHYWVGLDDPAEMDQLLRETLHQTTPAPSL